MNEFIQNRSRKMNYINQCEMNSSSTKSQNQKNSKSDKSVFNENLKDSVSTMHTDYYSNTASYSHSNNSPEKSSKQITTLNQSIDENQLSNLIKNKTRFENKRFNNRSILVDQSLNDEYNYNDELNFEKSRKNYSSHLKATSLKDYDNPTIDLRIKIRSSSKSKKEIEQIQKSKFQQEDYKPSKMGRTMDSFFKPTASLFGAQMGESRLKVTASNESLLLQPTTNMSMTMQGFNRGVKIRNLDKTSIRRDMNRFKNLEEPHVEQNFKPETLKKLTGYHNLAKVIFFTLREQSEEEVEFAELTRNLPNLAHLEMFQCNLTSIKHLGVDLPKLTKLSLHRCNLIDLKGISSLSHINSLNIAYNHLENTDGLVNMSHLEDLHLDGNNISSLKDINKIYTCHNLKSVSLLDNPVQDTNEQDIQDQITTHCTHLQILNYQPVEQYMFENIKDRYDSQPSSTLFNELQFQKVQKEFCIEFVQQEETIESVKNNIMKEETDNSIVLAVLKKEHRPKRKLDVNNFFGDINHNQQISERFRTLGLADDKHEMEEYDDAKHTRDQKQLEIANGGRMKNLKTIKNTVDITGDNSLLSQVQNQIK